MKPGDIVTVNDGSWSMSYVDDSFNHEHGNSLDGRRFRVLITGGQYPTEDHGNHGIPRNDIMLVDKNDPDCVVFARQTFCRVVTPPVPLDTVDLTIPSGVTKVTLHIKPTGQ